MPNLTPKAPTKPDASKTATTSTKDPTKTGASGTSASTGSIGTAGGAALPAPAEKKKPELQKAAPTEQDPETGAGAKRTDRNRRPLSPSRRRARSYKRRVELSRSPPVGAAPQPFLRFASAKSQSTRNWKNVSTYFGRRFR